MEGEPGRPRSVVGPLTAFIALTCVWGSSFFFTALSLRSFSYVQVATLRVMVGFVVLSMLAAAMRLRLPQQPRLYIHALVLGALSITVPFLMITAAQEHIDSSLAVILVSTTPIFVFLITTVLRMSKLSVATLAGILVSFSGVSSLYLGDGLAQLANSSEWPLVAIGCAFMFAVGNVYTRRYLALIHPITLALVQLGSALVMMVPIMVLDGLPSRVPNRAAVVGVLELGVLGSALAYVLFSYLIQVWGSTATSINTYLQPVVGLGLGLFALGEYISARAWTSIGIILTGVAIFALGSWRQLSRTRASAVTHF